jgi:Lrp/AsnC family transcriptional regulator, leucine-responsive regulatory protein
MPHVARQLDEIGWKIIAELQQDARISYAELARRVNLATQTVKERVLRLERYGVIRGYRAEIDPSKVGLPVIAFVGVNLVGDMVKKFANVVEKRPEIMECHRVSGAECFVLKVAVGSVAELEQLLDSLAPYVSVKTSLVLSSPLRHANILRPGSPSQSPPQPLWNARVQPHWTVPKTCE